ncbi:hypothetical protein UFOVP581_13 [uncultured Caudovirales phage]|uniref:Terminase small subunit n=1 Tax=uncultured Caudovirales phage TaxID=2100421 RepID=A0A6J5PI92_9CAUD|nr:hypothetical protein UFOVP581_13 [uncultured Caudovirales phage]
MLTPKQESFAQAIASGMTQADAYRHAYDVGADTKPETIWKRASELMEEGEVSGRVQELKEQLSKKALWTREMSVKALMTAYKDGNPSVKVSAVKELNAMHGFNAPTKTEITVSQKSVDEMTDEELAHTIQNG